jgi:hypothetical protein
MFRVGRPLAQLIASYCAKYRPPVLPPVSSKLNSKLSSKLNSNSAKDAYRSYLLAYASHSLKNIYDVKALDLVAVAKSFGFEVTLLPNFTT